MQQKLSQMFLRQEAGASGNNRIRTTRSTPKIEKICILNIYREHLLCLQCNASGRFLQTCIDVSGQRLKFSHFESSITTP